MKDRTRHFLKAIFLLVTGRELRSAGRLAFLVLAGSWLAIARAADASTALDSWLASQTNLVSWQAAFTQTRMLSTLNQPLTTHGRIWFVAPNRFRWELGDPPQTIAIRQAADMLIVYPRLKRAERYSLEAAALGPWKDAVALLDTGFPRSRSDLDAGFTISGVSETNGLHTATLRPKSATARKIMPEVQLTFSIADQTLRATQLRFADGSTMRNDFAQIVTNAVIADDVFRPALPPDYVISQPGTKKARR